MQTCVDVKYFLYLYEHKTLAPKTISKSIHDLYRQIDTNDIYTQFIFFIFFNDISTDIQPPKKLETLASRVKLIDYIKEHLFEKYSPAYGNLHGVHKNETVLDMNISQCESYEIYKFLLVMEQSIENMHLVDEKLVSIIVGNLTSNDVHRLLNISTKVSPLLVILIENSDGVPAQHKDFATFLKCLNLDFHNGFTQMSTEIISHRKLEKQIMNSKHTLINNYHTAFISFYPELIYSIKVQKDRLYYLNNPLKLPMTTSILKTYIMTNLYYMKLKNSKLDDANFDILYKLIYIERILQNNLTKKFCNLINQFVLDNPLIVYVLLGRKFAKHHIKILVKYVRSFHIAFEYSLKLFLSTNDEFYLVVLDKLLGKYKVKEFVTNIYNNLHAFPEVFVAKYKHLLDCL